LTRCAEKKRAVFVFSTTLLMELVTRASSFQYIPALLESQPAGVNFLSRGS
jgi:hypothetical protein